MSIQISGSSIPPDGTVTAAKISSGAAGDGQVLTADGAGMAAWEAAAGGGPGYLEYVALLTQIGTSNPVATVLKNTLGGTVVWTRTYTGNYSGTLSSGVFPVDKTVVLGQVRSWGEDVLLQMNCNDGNFIEILTLVVSTTETGSTTDIADGYLSRTPIEIRVYP